MEFRREKITLGLEQGESLVHGVYAASDLVLKMTAEALLYAATY